MFQFLINIRVKWTKLQHAEICEVARYQKGLTAASKWKGMLTWAVGWLRAWPWESWIQILALTFTAFGILGKLYHLSKPLKTTSAGLLGS